MSTGQPILMRMFGRPRGLLGRIGGAIMARMNRPCVSWVIADVLRIQPNDSVLEVGFGPGVGIECLVEASAANVAGVDPSEEMVGQARRRNANALAQGRVDLRLGSAERLPFDDDTFDAALAINSMQVWPDALTGLREMRRVLERGGRIALGFTPHSGQSKAGLTDLLASAGFADPRLIDSEHGFCALGTKLDAALKPSSEHAG
jgi:ubiquinone/menaquinone biosynthesis C-methylase UbiE